MAIDIRYAIEPSLQQLFRDSRDSLPLSNGYVLFFRDDARTVGKQVFRLTGASPNYSFIPYGFLTIDGAWRVDLTDWGAFEFPLYYFPYDADGNSQLYYIQIYAADGFQVASSIEAWPAFTESTPDETPVDINYAPNGQFLLHTDVVDTTVVPHVPGRISQPITDIAYGGWTFERPVGSTSVDIVTFERFGSPTPDIDQNPRYGLRVECQAPDTGDTFKDICLKFMDVNKFASDTQEYTDAFTAVSNSGSSVNAEVILKKNFGTGGSTPTEQSLGTFTVTTAESIVFVSFMFGDNSTKTIGLLDDDYLQLCVRLPVDDISDTTWTDAILTPDQVESPIFPVTPDSEMVYEGLAGFIDIPAYDGSQLYLPLILTPTGISFDSSSIGTFLWSADLTPPVGYLALDGNGYEVDTISPSGIPYSRLAAKWYDNVNNVYKFGTGSSFVTSDISLITPPAQLRLSTNSAGAVTNTADGTAATGFTFATIHTGATTYENEAWINFASNAATEGSIFILSNGFDFGGSMGAPSTDVAGWSIFMARSDQSIPLAGPGIRPSYSLFIDSVPGGGEYVYYEVVTTAETLQRNMVWFTVDGGGVQPVSPVADVYIRVDLLSTYNGLEVAKAVNEAINGRQISTIVTTAASTITAGDWWQFNTSTDAYYVWYTIDGAGADPMVANKTGIVVALLSADANTAVTSKTVIAINKFFVGVPQVTGQFIRIYDPTAELDAGPRYSNYSNLPATSMGTFEVDDITSHTHPAPELPGFWVTSAGNTDQFGGDSGYNFFNYTGRAGGQETRPFNLNLNLFVKY